jgi:signal transduction histidine kinase
MLASYARKSWLFAGLMFAAVAIPGAFMISAFVDYREGASDLARFETLQGEIRRLDEVLTMSARMAATSGEARWVERYEENIAPLDAALAEVTALAPDGFAAQMVDATSAANRALMSVENEAFDLVAQGRGADAYALLTSAEYETQKAIYAEGVETALNDARATFDIQSRQRRERLVGATVLSALMFLASFVLWVRMMHRSVRTQEALAREAAAERDAAAAANAAKSTFLANMSHELRTPLNAVIGYTEIVREGAVEADRTQDISDADKVLSAAHRLLVLIDGLLDLAKIEADKVSFEITAFDVRAFTEAAVATVRPSAAANGTTLVVEIAPDVGMVASDEHRLGQCLLNLMSNAVKFTPGGAVSITARRDGAWMDFAVADTGVGIDPDRLTTLFQPFVQADGSVERTFGGTGLGLAISREIARKLGGDITATSTPGSGSRFVLRVPGVPRGRVDVESAAPIAAAA